MVLQIQHKNPHRMRMAVMTVLACLLATSGAGCAATRLQKSEWWPGHVNSDGMCETCRSGQCLHPTCQAPGTLVEGETVEPLQMLPPSESPTGVPVESPQPPASTAQSSQVPEVPVIPSLPEATAPSALQEIPVAPISEPLVSMEDLNRCQNQMAELYSRFSNLEETHQESQQSLALLLAEQRRLKLDNERLMKELELNHQQDIESLDSLSKIIEDVVTAPAEDVPESPAAEGNVTKDAELPTTRLPAVETSL